MCKSQKMLKSNHSPVRIHDKKNNILSMGLPGNPSRSYIPNSDYEIIKANFAIYGTNGTMTSRVKSVCESHPPPSLWNNLSLCHFQTANIIMSYIITTNQCAMSQRVQDSGLILQVRHIMYLHGFIVVYMQCTSTQYNMPLLTLYSKKCGSYLFRIGGVAALT